MTIEPARVIVADPPWRHRDQLPGPKRGASKHYRLLTVEEIVRFPLPPIADDALLCLWRVASMQQEALDVARWWGFTVKAELVWSKMTVTGKPFFGMGRIVRGAHEVCLLATRGKFKVADRSVRSRFSANVGEHSAKPEEFYKIVEKLSPGPYVELFSRRARPDWICLGDEAPSTA